MPSEQIVQSAPGAAAPDLSPIDPDRGSVNVDGAEFVVTAHGLGQFQRGDKIRSYDPKAFSEDGVLKEGYLPRGSDPEKLIALGAMTRLTEDAPKRGPAEPVDPIIPDPATDTGKAKK